MVGDIWIVTDYSRDPDTFLKLEKPTHLFSLIIESPAFLIGTGATRVEYLTQQNNKEPVNTLQNNPEHIL
jgi:hypothetical protein